MTSAEVENTNVSSNAQPALIETEESSAWSNRETVLASDFELILRLGKASVKKIETEATVQSGGLETESKPLNKTENQPKEAFIRSDGHENEALYISNESRLALGSIETATSLEHRPPKPETEARLVDNSHESSIGTPHRGVQSATETSSVNSPSASRNARASPEQITKTSEFLTPFHLLCVSGVGENEVVIEGTDGDFLRAFKAALWAGNDEIIDVMIQDKTILERVDSGFKAFHLAVIHNKEKYVRQLIREGADVNKLSDDDISPLTLAIGGKDKPIYPESSKRSSEIVQLLLENGAKPDLGAVLPIHAASNRGDAATVELLIKAGAKVTPKVKRGAKKNDIVLNQFLSNPSRAAYRVVEDEYSSTGYREVNLEALENFRPLHFAARIGNVPTIAALLKAGHDINSTTSHKETALHFACRAGHGPATTFLCSHGLNVNAKDQDKKAAIITAIQAGHHQVVKILCEHKANVNGRYERGRTPLHEAAIAETHGAKIVEILVDAGAEINKMYFDAETPLDVAKRKGNLSTCQAIYNRGGRYRMTPVWSRDYSLLKDNQTNFGRIK